MSWLEFKSLLSGLSHKTPLGNVVQIRSEDDSELLKHFTKEQHRIRNEWRTKHQITKFSVQAFKDMQTILKQAFG